MKILKVCKEALPAVQLAGKRFTDADRDEMGFFSKQWQACFNEGWRDVLTQSGTIPGVSDDMIGACPMGSESGFEYWIGVFLSPDAPTPEGFESVLIPAGELGVCWLYGNGESGELFDMEAFDRSMTALSEQGWNVSPEKGWFFERYNAPRFTVPDESGNVILDICAVLIP